MDVKLTDLKPTVLESYFDLIQYKKCYVDVLPELSSCPFLLNHRLWKRNTIICFPFAEP